MDDKEKSIKEIEENINNEIKEEELKEKELTKEEIITEKELEEELVEESKIKNEEENKLVIEDPSKEIKPNKSKETVLKTPDLSVNKSLTIETIIKEESETAENICNILIELIKKYPDDKYSSKFPKYLKCKMEEQFGKGWNVFVGEHFCGVCSYEEDTLVQVKVGYMMVLIFKTYISDDQ
ncbi:dynein light chain 1 [Tubulinosema ratisbonensis]|uniref:Dynein light chain 1 n=1 Tax=Tubulinosema ratisbonensis TaxID=291195 RepID=A0A437AL52_9MICR|nr:dynein light chain 1 [Tubulinosema ratisbonensis]